MVEFFTSQLGVSITLAAIGIGVLMGATAYCIYFERKIAAWIQDRMGPNRVGPAGVFQPLADGGKFLFKEDIIPGHVDKKLFVFAPALAFVVAMIGFVAIPWGGMWQLEDNLVHIQVANPDIGLLYILGVAGVGVYGIVLGAWASNNKFSFFGGIRATAQMVSYEIPLGLSILIVVLTVGEVRLEQITLEQTEYWFGGLVPKWNVFLHPIAFVVLYISTLAEANRAPFDLAEAEQELVGGFHTEYNSMKFGLFFLGEYAHLITSSAMISVLFLGGWHLPWLSLAQPEATGLTAVLVKVAVLAAKSTLLIFITMWVRWTLPRFRFDQLMHLAWKAVIPMMLVLFVMSVVLLHFQMQRSVLALVGNLVVLAAVLMLSAVSKREISGRQKNMPPVTRMSGLMEGVR